MNVVRSGWLAATGRVAVIEELRAFFKHED